MNYFWTISRKIRWSFGFELLLVLILGILILYSLSQVDTTTREGIVQGDIAQMLLAREIDHLNWAGKVSALFTDPGVRQLEVATDSHKCAFGKWYYSEDRKRAEQGIPGLKEPLQQIEEPHQHLHQSAVEIGECLKQPDSGPEGVRGVSPLSTAGKSKALDVFQTKTVPALRSVQKILREAGDLVKTETTSTNTQIKDVLASTARHTKVLLGVIFLLGGILAFSISRNIHASLAEMADQLETGSHALDGASAEISDAGQSLAEGTNQQAAGLEESTAALQEIAGRSKDVGELSRGTEQLMAENISKTGQSMKSLVELTKTMSRIEADGSEMGKIIKTIDEIAFQTNLLALNAAVEAARAGEAGKGFAVVAEEVRALARRAAEAARTTQTLLESTITRVGQAGKDIRSMNKNFDGIVETATVIGEKSTAVNKAVADVTRSIQQISQSFAELDSVVQKNAANAEESAAAGEELNAQAREFRGMVAHLLLMINGVSGRH